MTLSRKIAVAVDERAGAGPGTVSAEDGPYRLELAVVEAGRLGVEAERLDFRVADRPDWPLEALKGWADRLADRVSYLMEPLALVEADADEGEVELRSKAPTPRDERRSYYQVRLGRDGSLRMVRLAFGEPDRRRRPATFQLTREVLERLADDLVASVG